MHSVSTWGCYARTPMINCHSTIVGSYSYQRGFPCVSTTLNDYMSMSCTPKIGVYSNMQQRVDFFSKSLWYIRNAIFGPFCCSVLSLRASKWSNYTIWDLYAPIDQLRMILYCWILSYLSTLEGIDYIWTFRCSLLKLRRDYCLISLYSLSDGIWSSRRTQ